MEVIRLSAGHRHLLSEIKVAMLDAREILEQKYTETTKRITLSGKYWLNVQRSGCL